MASAALAIAKAMKSNHAWLVRFRLANDENRHQEISAFVANQIARFVDELIEAVIAEHRSEKSVCEKFQQWAREAVDEWDGQSNAELLKSMREKFGQTEEQFYERG